MTSEPERPLPEESGQTSRPAVLSGQFLGLVLAAIAIPLAIVAGREYVPSLGKLPDPQHGGYQFDTHPQMTWERVALAEVPEALPKISNVQIVDFNGDGRNEVLATDAGRNCLLVYEQDADGQWIERIIAEHLGAPAHPTLVDIDGDGDLDILVSVLGNLSPDDGRIGQLILLENVDGEYRRHVLLDDVYRVADAQPGDFDGDGDIDIAVACFGYSRGHVLWLENRGDLKFRAHVLHSAPGTIHVPVADFNGDGIPDIAAIVTQDEEELWVFESLGNGEFRKHLIHRWHNYDIGGAGLVAADLDSDGDIDLIVPVGDNLEDHTPYPQPYHGCFWFENRGNFEFVGRRIAEYGGTYAAAVADLNADGHQDVVLVSMANNWHQPGNASIIWLENDGAQNFRPWEIDTSPTHLVTVACGDLDGDGRPDVVAGGLHLRPPYSQIGRITAWMNRGEGE